MDPQVLTSRLRAGDQLEIVTGGGAFEVWAEPFTSPPSTDCQGERFDLKDLHLIVERILSSVSERDARCRWVED